ncbi:MAG: hypothetical protein HQQ73_10540 [Desulfobulbaceae bacterium]|nr:hypothetical protein [Desulfobulbaceae bacterium]
MRQKRIQRYLFLVFLGVILCFFSGCGGANGPDYGVSNYSGPVYPETREVEVVFQVSQTQPFCRVFAELFAFFPADVSAKTIETALLDEARARGAQVVLIGQSRISGTEDGYRLLYFGPEREYALDRGWNDWTGGYDIWKKQLDWLSLGHGEWGREDVLYPEPLVLQVAMLRCH